MANTSSGPSWTLTHPQQWDYYSQIVQCPWDGSLIETMAEVEQRGTVLGREGWEMVNFAVVPQYSDGVGGGEREKSAMIQATRFRNQIWTVITMFKRPIVP
jgi:hypothetical protein